ncbi:MAG: hypothetical protein LC713_03510 [Actinobacteria bacterium]|nr:hypothetical protein [Actinomycetota bacterium]
MNRKTVLWSITLFFGCWIVFGAIDSAAGGDRLLSLGLQAVVLATVVAAIVLIDRRRS